MNKKSVLLIGANSDLAKALSKQFALKGFKIHLAARDIEEAKINKSDLEIRFNAAVKIYKFDALNISNKHIFINQLAELPDIAVCLVGHLGHQQKDQYNIEQAIDVMRTNFEGPATIMSIIANKFEERGSGILVGVSSVAGERGRASNYIYGSSKAGFTAFLSGLRNRLKGKGVHVITIIPGFMRTKMTVGLHLPYFLTASPETTAKHIIEAIDKKRNVIYSLGVWKLIMFLIRLIPENIFKRLKI